MSSRHVVATIALLVLGGLALGVSPLPGTTPVIHGGALLLAASLGLWVSAQITARVGPWRGALTGGLVGALVPLVGDLGCAGWALLDGHWPERLSVGVGRSTGEGWLAHVVVPAAIFGPAYVVVQIAPRSVAPWRRLLVALLAPQLALLGVSLCAVLELFHIATDEHALVAIVVTVVGCLRGTDHPSDVLRPLARLAQRLAGLEPRELELGLDAVPRLDHRRQERA